jgi:hypothetical protein
MVWSGKGGPPIMNREVILKACKEREGYTVREEYTPTENLEYERQGQRVGVGQREVRRVER